MNTSRIGDTPKLGELLSLLWSRLGHRKLRFVASWVFSLGEILTGLLVPLILEIYYNQLETANISYINGLLTAMMIALVLLMAVNIVGFYLKQDTVSALHRDITVELADQAQQLRMETAAATHTADMSQRIQDDSSKSAWTISILAHGIGGQLVMLILAVTYLFVLQWQIALGIIVLMPLGVIGSHMLRGRLKKLGLAVAEQEAAVLQCQQDALQGMETLRAYGAEEWMTSRFVKQRQQLNKLYMRRMWWQQLVNVISSVLSLLVTWGSILAAAWLAIEGELQLGALMAVFLLIWRVYNPLLSLGNLWAEVQGNLGAAARVAALWNAKKEPAIAASASEAVTGRYAIEMIGVHYTYKENVALASSDTSDNTDNTKLPFLKDINLSIAHGAFTALVGPSGSGKSTIAKIAAGLYLPDSGECCVSLYGRDPRIHMEAARANIAYVPQTPYLFAGTIRENLLAGNPQRTEAEMRAAAATAGADSFIMALPDGYDTNLKEHGSSLSGGQRQRLAIARALLSDRPVLVLDEATSALDTDTEREVMEALIRNARMTGRTLLTIAHRLTTVQDADRIIVMESGQMREDGTHHELLQKRNSLYSQLWRQMGSVIEA